MNKSQPSIPKDFRGLRWEPSNEQEVVMLFGLLIPHLPRPLAIEFIQTPFPDCKATDIETNQPVWIEFELYSRHYLDHNHHKQRLETCDWIVCWHDNLAGDRADLPKIVPLDEIVAKQPRPEQYTLNRRPTGATHEQYFGHRILGLSEVHQRVIQQLIDFAKAAKLQIEWPETNGACFTVRGNVEYFNVEYFKVDSNGRVGTPFSPRWKKAGVSTETRTSIVGDLNKALGKLWFSSEGKKSFDIACLFPNEGTVRGYIDVWQRVSIENDQKD